MPSEIRRAVADEFPVVADLCVAAYEPFLLGDRDRPIGALRDVAGRRGGRAGVVCSTLPEMLAAHRIYRRMGFWRAPERDWSPVPGVDLIAFVRPLVEVG